MSDWQDFEKLAHLIYAELSPGATVTWNEKVWGHDSETPRQIDVTIRWSADGTDYLHIVQARDRTAPADVNDVGEFASVVQDVRASGGSLVCRGGYTKSARTPARNRGLDLHQIHDAQSQRWSVVLQVPLLWVDLIPVLRPSLRVWLDAGESIEDHFSDMQLTTDGGKTRLLPMKTFERLWNDGQLDQRLGMQHVLHDPRPVSARVLTADGTPVWRPVTDFRLSYTVTRNAWLGWFTPAECRGIVDHVDHPAFFASHLPITQIPGVRAEDWHAVDDPDQIAVSIRGTVVTSTGYEVSPPEEQAPATFLYLGNDPPPAPR